MQADFSVEGYELDSLLTANATGELWLGSVQVSGDAVALKRVRLRDAPAVEGLKRLVKLLGMIDHPHLQRIQELKPLGDDVAVLVLEHADGGNLDHLLSGRGGLDPGEVVTTIGPVAEALAAAHERGLVHGDLSPGTILFTSEGRPMIGDIGLLALVARSDVADALGGGPAAAVAPGAGEQTTPADDVYALAAVTYAALSGQQPVPGQPHRPLQELVPDCPPGLVHAVEAGLAPVAERRPEAAQFAELVYGACPPTPVRFPVGLMLSDEQVAEALAQAGVQPPDPNQPAQGPAQPPPGQVPGQPQQPGQPPPLGQQPQPGQPGAVDPFVQAGGGPPSSPPAERAGPAFEFGGVMEDYEEEERSGIGRWILIGVLVLVLVGGVAAGGYWWWTNRSDTEPSVSGTPSPGSDGEPTTGPSPTGGNTPTPTPTPTQGSTNTPEERWRNVLDELDARRAEAFAKPDPDLLANVYAPGSELLAADQDIVRQYVQQGARLENLKFEIQDLTVGGGTANRQVLDVLNQRLEHTVVFDSGQTQTMPAAQPVLERITLVRTPGAGWLISETVQL